jgi:DNA-binding MarR family transcriptional regulator
MKDALSKTVGLNKQPWIKLPFGTWKLLVQSGYTAHEIGVVLFFYHKLCSNTVQDSTVVFATNQEIMDFSGVTRRVFYYAIDKMCKKGMIKKAPNTYDLADYLRKMDIRGDMYINKGLSDKEEK